MKGCEGVGDSRKCDLPAFVVTGSFTPRFRSRMTHAELRKADSDERVNGN